MTTQETAIPTARTASITLKAAGSTMRLNARRRPDQTAESFVTTTDAEKRTVRGMTEVHADMQTAKAAIEALAAKAQKLGWEKGQGRGFVAKPDAFATLPAPPKAAKK